MKEPKKKDLPAMIEAARVGVESRKAFVEFDLLVKQPVPERASFAEALRAPGISLIAEYKRSSPSAGDIKDRGVRNMLAAYERGGAAALSVLTDFPHFRGMLEDLKLASERTELPVLRKDFIFDDYQIVESSRAGASAVLLIVAALSPEELARLHQLATDEGLDVLVEAHDKAEVRVALDIGAPIIGVNNRNLKDLSVDLGTSAELIKSLPEGVVKISESGIKTRDDVREIENLGFDAVLVGESLLHARSPAIACSELLKD